MSNQPQIGSVSTATMRPQDLIPSMYEEIEWLSPKILEAIHKEFPITAKDSWPDDNAEWWQADEATWLLEALFDTLNEMAPPLCYFGSHPVDGADYGFWPIEEVLSNPDMDEDYDLARGEELPATIKTRYFLVVNERGNSTLYQDLDSQWVECWSIV